MRQRLLIRRQRVTSSALTSASHLNLQRHQSAILTQTGNTDNQELESTADLAGESLPKSDFSRISTQSTDRLGTPIEFSASVGKNGTNLPEDVEKIQTRLTALDFAINDIAGQCGNNTQDAIVAFQQYFLKNPDGLIEVDSPSHMRLNQLQGPIEAKTPKPMQEDDNAETTENIDQVNMPQFKVKRGREFAQSIDGKSIDTKLLQTLDDFFKYLIGDRYVEGDIVLLEGMRDPKKAHRWSTAYSIRNEQVPLDALKALTAGRDVDGNQWYEEGETLEQAKRRAANLGLNSPSTPASEGYPQGDLKCVPNTWAQGISNHLLGKAVKVLIPWTTEKQGQLNDPIANDLIKKFGLKRPVPKDETHFELQDSPQGEEEHGHQDSES